MPSQRGLLTGVRTINRTSMESEVQHPVSGPPGPEKIRSVALIVVTYRSSALLPDFFAALPEALDGVPEYELVVVDNASGDGTVDAVRRLAPGCTIVERGSNGGYAAGLNDGIAAARPSDAVLVLNPDIRLRPGCVKALLRALERPGVGISAPRILGEGGRLQHSLHRSPTILRAWGDALLGGRRAGRFSLLGETIVDDSAYSKSTSAAWASGAALAISAACARKVGRWTEEYFLYSEETEYCLRARDAGFDVQLVPDAEAVHIGGEMTTSPRLWAMQAWNRVRLFRSRHNALASLLFRAGVLVNEALRTLAGSRIHMAGFLSVLSRRHRPSEVSGSLGREGGSHRVPGYICFSAQDFWYHNRAHSDIQLMRNVAATRRVLFVNSIGMRMPLPGRSTKPLRRIWRKVKSTAKLLRRPLKDVPNFHVMTPVTVPLYGSPLARRLNAWLVRTQVRVIARLIGIREAAYIVTIPTAWDVVRTLPRTCLVYNRSDLHSSFPEVDRVLIQGYERQLLENSDHVLYVSRALMEAERHMTGDRAYFIDHGVDLHHFKAVPPSGQPAEVRDLPRPRIGFFGGLDDYIIDFDLLERIAVEIPEASLILVGDATCSMDRYSRLANVHWLGFQPYELIPAYGSSFDVALMPWLKNDWIKHSNPIKLKEYLALGLPIVTMDFPEARNYADRLFIASDAGEFIAAIRHALRQPPDPDALRASVLRASWESKAGELIHLCEGSSELARGEVSSCAA